MDYAPCSFFSAIGRRPEFNLIEELGITSKTLASIFAKIISAMNIAVLDYCKKKNTTQTAFLYKHTESLQITGEYRFETDLSIYCVTCRTLVQSEVVYTFRNTQNLKALSINPIQLHHLLHGDFEKLGCNPRQIHDVLGVGYYCGGV